MHPLPDSAASAVVELPDPQGLRAPVQDVRLHRGSAHDHDLLTAAEGSRRLGVFVDFMRAAGLASLMLEPGPFTVLAPIERAFQKFSVRERDALLADAHRLVRVMRGHVLVGHVLTPTSDGSLTGTTIDGEPCWLTSTDGTVSVKHARIVQANIHASNGVIHAIDSVLL